MWRRTLLLQNLLRVLSSVLEEEAEPEAAGSI